MEEILEEARQKHKAGDDLTAITLLTELLARDEHQPEARLLRGEAFQSMGCLKEAEEDVDLLLTETAAENFRLEVLLLKAALRLKQGDTDEALTYYNKVKDNDPSYGAAYTGLCQAYAAHRQLDRALAVMDEALQRLPDFAEGYKERGRVKFLLHDEAGAIDDLKQALRLSPEMLSSLNFSA